MAGVVNGRKYILLLDGKYLGFCTSHTINFESATRDISVRETENWHTNMHGMREMSVDCEGLWAQTNPDGTLNSANAVLFGGVMYQIPPVAPFDIVELGIMKQHCYTVTFVDWTDHSAIWEAKGWVQSFSLDTPMEDSSTFNMSFKARNEPKFETYMSP